MFQPVRRDRTALFEQFRRSYRTINLTVVQENQNVDSDQLIQTNEIELRSFTPSVAVLWREWTTKKDQLLLFLKDIENSIDRLKFEYEAEAIPKINWLGNDENNDQSMAGHLIRQVTNMFLMAHQKIEGMSKTQSELMSPQAIELKKNAKLAMLGRLGSLADKLRQVQGQREKKIQSLRSLPLKTLQKFSSPIQTLQLFDETSTLLEERGKDLNSISKSTGELLELMKSLKMIVVDQGSLLDRVDYNLERAQRFVSKGKSHLIKTQIKQSQMRVRKMILLFLILLIIILLIGILSK